MLRILVADDEADEREVILFLLEKYGFQAEVQTAANGADALQLLRLAPPDILITDVQMPFLSGTELALQARQLIPDLMIFFFSGHDDFKYARQAITAGALDYILKPIIPEEFCRTMRTAIQKVEARLKAQAEQQNSGFFRRDHIFSLLLGGAGLDLLRERFGDVTFLDAYRQLLLLQFDTPVFDQTVRQEEAPLKKLVAEVLPENGFYTLNLNPHQSAVLLAGDGAAHLPRQTAAKLQALLSAQYGCPCYLSVSPTVPGPGGLAQALADAEQALEDRFFCPDQYLYPVVPAAAPGGEPAVPDDGILQVLEQAVAEQDEHGMYRGLQILFGQYSGGQEPSHIYIRYVFSKVAAILCRAFPDAADLPATVEAIYRCRDFSEIQACTMRLADQAAQRFHQGEDTTHHTIQIVCKYIREHLAEDLSLETLAGVAYLSPRYLSDLFSRQTGSGLNKYIKRLRMESAGKLLLQTNKKVSDICKEVGYNNFSYFCRSFRDYFGCSPEAYRQAADGAPAPTPVRNAHE